MDAILDATGNPSSVHGPGRRARARIDQAREALARWLGLDPSEIVFTAGATEANNLALHGSARPAISAMEHDSVRAPVGDRAIYLPAAGDGQIDVDEAQRLIDQHQPDLVSVMAANNETGVIQPITNVASIAKNVGALVHVDAVQVPGRMDLAPITAVADLLTLSSHKVGGPKGVGALVIRGGTRLPALMAGGGQERYRRPGTENDAGIVGFAAALTALEDGESQRVRMLRDRFEAGVLARCAGVRIIGHEAPRIGNTSCLALPGPRAETQVIAMDMAGLCVSAGAACSSGKVAASHVLAAMGLDDDIVERAVRMSFGWANTIEEADQALDILEELCRGWSKRAA